MEGSKKAISGSVHLALVVATIAAAGVGAIMLHGTGQGGVVTAVAATVGSTMAAATALAKHAVTDSPWLNKILRGVKKKHLTSRIQLFAPEISKSGGHTMIEGQETDAAVAPTVQHRAALFIGNGRWTNDTADRMYDGVIDEKCGSAGDVNVVRWAPSTRPSRQPARKGPSW